ncbi:DUF3574 domain-containing protein [Asaia prunellae]|uniref:DUF3574 domain-containing protein n=1 Tax=Asaia prunellae TaxID=610245 RepID=UPI00046F22F5|nr:DUF3574 domain-containing protein [Asaia prunellae]
MRHDEARSSEKTALCTRFGGYEGEAVTLAFGLSLPGGGEVSRSQWTRFLAENVTPRFPSGFSVIEAEGQWQNGRHEPVLHEKSRLIWIITSQKPELLPALEAIRSSYKKQFNQSSVGAFIHPICASF